MGLLSGSLGYDYGGRIRDRRRSRRRTLGNPGWIRLDGDFAVRPCKVLEASNAGVRISVERLDSLTGEFTLMPTRTESRGRRAKVKWRRGSQVGAVFL